MLRRPRLSGYSEAMKQPDDRLPATPRTTRPVRCWIADAEWVRREAFERRVPSAEIMREAIERLRDAKDRIGLEPVAGDGAW